ncbi:hypothetical protein EV715DRAFT_212388, partial [Schizophyllum commune]
LTFFYKQYKRKSKRGQAPVVQLTHEQEDDAQLGEPITADEEALADAAEADAADAEAAVPPEQLAHDQEHTTTVKKQAIYEMAARGVHIGAEQEKQALTIMPKVSGLARRVHDAPSTLKNAFDRIVRHTPGITSGHCTLSRKVPTRWNSEARCLDDHLELRPAVEKLIVENSPSLNAYRLSATQWSLAGELNDLLGIFVPITEYFSKKEQAFVVEVLEQLERVRNALAIVRDTESTSTSNVVRVAAHAGIITADKYLKLLNKSEVYEIAIVLCPDRKLEWFRTHGYSEAAISAVRARATERWTKSYKPTPATEIAPTPPVATYMNESQFVSGISALNRSVLVSNTTGSGREHRTDGWLSKTARRAPLLSIVHLPTHSPGI